MVMNANTPHCPYCGSFHLMKANIDRIPYWQCLRADCKRYFIMQHDRLALCQKILDTRPDLADVKKPGVTTERIFVFWERTYSWRETIKRIYSVLLKEDPQFFIRAIPATTIDRDFRGRDPKEEQE